MNIFKKTQVFFVFFVKKSSPKKKSKFSKSTRKNIEACYKKGLKVLSKDCEIGKGIIDFCFSECFKIHSNLKIDTHRDNIPMQKVLLRNGFEYCGISFICWYE